jgi:GTP diphosphokinase / guanosine-3',5'-bis(diphosphate) 3'-diphosphatase
MRGIYMTNAFWESVLGWDEMEVFSKAYKVAMDAHEGQERDEGTPYITHIDGVVDILTNELDIKLEMVLSVAILHDVLEDSDKYPYEKIKELFGANIANGVMLLTKKKGQP